MNTYKLECDKLPDDMLEEEFSSYDKANEEREFVAMCGYVSDINQIKIREIGR